MSSLWDTYPTDYRAHEVQACVSAVQAGECVSVVGLSGAGKSNLLGFLAQRVTVPNGEWLYVDCNQLAEPTGPALTALMIEVLGGGETEKLTRLLAKRFASNDRSLAILLDRFDALPTTPPEALPIASQLRAWRDAHKYRLTFLTATRRPVYPHTELAELFFANTLWLGPLSASDAHWTVRRYAERKRLNWNSAIAQTLIDLTGGYPSFLRAACEAHAAGAPLTLDTLRQHPALQSRLAEFWADNPTAEELRLCGLTHVPVLQYPVRTAPAISIETQTLTLTLTPAFDTSRLTAKEHTLLAYLQTHPNQVCEKDEVIRAIWPEDRVFERGVRDDSLAQLVRRLREKIEPDPSQPKYLMTVPGRGYRFVGD